MWMAEDRCERRERVCDKALLGTAETHAVSQSDREPDFMPCHETIRNEVIMRIERERIRFVCAECGNEIKFGDEDAVCYDNEIYCSDYCAKDAAGIDYYDWDGESEFTERTIPEESNGFLVSAFDNDYPFFSNGQYAIFSKLPSDLDEEYLNSGRVKNVNFKHFGELVDIKDFFEENCQKFVQISGERFKVIRDGNKIQVEMFGETFDKDLLSYVLKQIRHDGLPVMAIIDDELLYLFCGEKRACLCECDSISLLKKEVDVVEIVDVFEIEE